MLKNQVYSPYLITEKALDFIDRNASKSFFLYFTPTLPHAELIVPKESLQDLMENLMKFHFMVIAMRHKQSHVLLMLLW